MDFWEISVPVSIVVVLAYIYTSIVEELLIPPQPRQHLLFSEFSTLCTLSNLLQIQLSIKFVQFNCVINSVIYNKCMELSKHLYNSILQHFITPKDLCVHLQSCPFLPVTQITTTQVSCPSVCLFCMCHVNEVIQYVVLLSLSIILWRFIHFLLSIFHFFLLPNNTLLL